MKNNRVKAYQKTFQKYGATPRALRWKSEESAVARYKKITQSADFEGKSILDVGCGFGDIIPFLQEVASSFSYTGVDMVPEFVVEARKRYPEKHFVLRDYFSNPLDDDFDIVICNGALNSNLGTDKENLSFRKKAIKSMFDHTRKTLIFNMAGMYLSKGPGSKIWWANPLDIFEYCLGLTPELVFESGYKPREFLLKLGRFLP